MTDGDSFLWVMMIDDNEDDILLVREAFDTTRFCRIGAVARDGEEALAGLSDCREGTLPSVILLDINLPKKDGFEVLEDLKSDPRLRAIPVIVLTTSARDEDVARAYRLEASSVISKPATHDRLNELVRSFDMYWGETVRLPKP